MIRPGLLRRAVVATLVVVALAAGVWVFAERVVARAAARAPLFVWIAADALDAADVRSSPGGPRDPGVWMTGSERGEPSYARRRPPPTAVERWIARATLRVIEPPSRPIVYVASRLVRTDADGRPWHAAVRRDVSVASGTPRIDIAGAWEIRVDDAPAVRASFEADGKVRVGRFEGAWSVAEGCLLLDVAAWDDPVLLVTGAAFVSADGRTFEGVSVDPAVRVIRGARGE